MKNEEATLKTTSALLKIAGSHFTRYGYHLTSLEKIAAEGAVTRGAVYHHFRNKQGLFTAVLEQVQKDVSRYILKEASKSDDPWQQLILGSVGFVKGANVLANRRILLVDAPVVLGWETWRKIDQENSTSVLREHIKDLKQQGLLHHQVTVDLMTYAVSGATTELALNYLPGEHTENEVLLTDTISRLVNGFRA